MYQVSHFVLDRKILVSFFSNHFEGNEMKRKKIYKNVYEKLIEQFVRETEQKICDNDKDGYG